MPRKKKNEPIIENVVIEDQLEPSVVEADDLHASTGVVICSKLNVRSNPSMESGVLNIISKDDKVTILSDEEPDWYKIKTAKGFGYCMKKFIQA